MQREEAANEGVMLEKHKRNVASHVLRNLLQTLTLMAHQGLNPQTPPSSTRTSWFDGAG